MELYTDMMNDTTPSPIVIVSGLPRSGTSMAMRMLAAGGMPLLVDEVRTADDSNPLGYFEFDPVKRSKDSVAWVAEAEGKAVKVVSPLLQYLPEDRGYRIIFMKRPLDAVLASQRQMMERSGKSVDDNAEAALRGHFEAHLAACTAALSLRADCRVLYLDYEGVVADTEENVGQIARFLGGDWNVSAMAKAVQPKLLHERGNGCA